MFIPSCSSLLYYIAQVVVAVCNTAIWNQVLQNLAGSQSSAGSTATLLSSPYDLDFDVYRNMYVVDRNNHRIQRFPSGYRVYRFFANKFHSFHTIAGSSSGTTVAGFSLGAGSSRSELYYPSAIHVTANNTMFILDTYNFRVLQWQIGEPLGYIVAGGAGAGSGFNQISYSYGMFVDEMLNIYVSDSSNHRVTLWRRGNTTAGVLVSTLLVTMRTYKW